MPVLFDGSENLGAAPQPDEIEVSLIGPGYGECVLVHFGDSNWVITDSCRVPGTAKSAALLYLDAIDVDPDSVRLVVASHWDDDHIKGFAELVTSCTAADVAFSAALSRDEFFAYTATYAIPLTRTVRSGVTEMHRVQKALGASGRPVRLASANRRLYGPADFSLAHGLPIEIWSLSPSDEEFDNFLIWLATQIPGAGETRRVAIARKNNDLSTVIYISVGNDTILLGADLEEEGKPTTGWSAIIDGAGRPDQRASLIKIAHHGSENGDHSGIWDDLLTPEPFALLAPFKRGKESLPKEQDVTRISGRTPNGFATTGLGSRAPMKRDATVEKTIRASTISFSSLPQRPGMLRLRKKAGQLDDWAVERFGGAVPLAQILS